MCSYMCVRVCALFLRHIHGRGRTFNTCKSSRLRAVPHKEYCFCGCVYPEDLVVHMYISMHMCVYKYAWACAIPFRYIGAVRLVRVSLYTCPPCHTKKTASAAMYIHSTVFATYKFSTQWTARTHKRIPNVTCIGRAQFYPTRSMRHLKLCHFTPA